LADNAALPPQGIRVRVIDPATTAADAASVLALNLALVALAMMSIAAAIRGSDTLPALLPSRGVICVALLLIIGGWLLIGAFRAIAPSGVVRAWLPLLGTALIASGWVLGGGALRPRGSAVRGAVLAAVLYVILGLVWVIAYNAALGVPLARVVTDPYVVLIVLAWPLQIAQVLGLFGLTIG